MANTLDFSDLGAKEAKPLDFSDLEATEVSPKSSITKGDSALAGAQQGATLGFGDEIQGGIESGMDATQALLNKLGLAGPAPSQVNELLASQGVKGDLGPKSTLEMYQRARDASRKDFDAAANANPGAYTAGAIGGGALTAMAAPQMLMNPGGQVAKSAPLLEKMLMGAAKSVPSSAVVGVGTSNADLTKGEVANSANDVLNSVELGAGLGAGIPLATAAIAAPVKAISQSKTMQDILESYRSGLDNLDLSSPQFLKNSRDKLKEIAGQVDDKIRETTQKLLGEKKTIMDNLEKSGVKADTKSVIQGLADFEGSSSTLRDDERTAIRNATKGLMSKGYLKSPMEIENAIKDLGDIKGQMQTSSGFKAVDDSIKALKTIQDSMDPQIQQINKKLFQTIDAGDSLMKRGALEYGNGAQDLSNKEAMASLFENSNKYKTESTLDDILNKGLETSKNVDIAPLKDLVPEAADLIGQTPQIAKRMDLGRNIQKPAFDGQNIIGSTIKAVKTGSGYAANKAGLAVAENKDFLQQGIKRLSDSTPEQLKTVASNIARVGGEKGAAYAKILTESAGKNNVSKNAMMFGLMQQPEFRDLLRKTTNEEVESGNVAEPVK